MDSTLPMRAKACSRLFVEVVEALIQSLHCFEAVLGLDWTKHSMSIGAVIFEGSVVFVSGNTCSVRDRQISSEYAGMTKSVFNSNQAVVTFSNVCSVSARLASASVLR
ncbi:hypothetical protein KS461_04010 [Pseudomonas chlororaphis]|nr:hypothetical protein KS461_04010 [Pseudomonas chlororaphis]